MGSISLQNKWLAAEKIFSNSITIWNIATRKELRTLPRLKSQIVKVAFSSCNKFVGVSSKENQIVIWEVESGREAKRLKKKNATLAMELLTIKQDVEQDGVSQPASRTESKSE